MVTGSDNRVIIEALKEKKAKLQDDIAQIDRHIKQLQTKPNDAIPHINGVEIADSTPKAPFVPINKTAKIKNDILDIFDFYKHPIKMSDVQEKYMEGKPMSDFHVRESVRGLNSTGQLKLMKINKSNRNAYWVKTEWVDRETKQLKDEYKWEGFDNLFNPDELTYS